MPQCAVVSCNNTHRRTKGGSIKYHRFPGDSGIRNQWLNACGKTLNNCSTARICSRHFSDGSYERDVQHELLGLPTRCRLKRGAIPDQNLPTDFLKEEGQPESAIAILLAVGLVPANNTSVVVGGLPQELSESRYHRWLKALGIDPAVKEISNFNRVCSAHFNKEDITMSPRGRMVLKHGAIPRLNLGPNVEKRKCLLAERRAETILKKMQIMEDVREGCDANPPSSPGHAEERHVGGQLDEVIKTEDVTENGLGSGEVKEDMEDKEVLIKEEQDDKKSDEEAEDKHEENSSHSSISENNSKRKLEHEPSPIKRLKTDIEDHFNARDKIMNEFVEIAECTNLEQIQSFSDQILSEIKTLNELAKEKEREWNHLLHMKKLKEELLIRLQRKRQVLIINDSDLNEFQPEANGQQSLLKCNQKVNMLRELRATNLEKLKQRTSLLNTAYKQKPMLDVQAIIADYRQRHPETVPRRGGNFTIGQKNGSDNSETGSLINSMNGSQDDSRSSTHNAWYRSGEDVKAYKDILLHFSKLAQSEKSELQSQVQSLSKPPPPYPEVTVHPVTGTSSVAPTNSLLHGILTKAPVRQNNANGTSNAAINNGGKTSFSPTLARLLTAPEKASAGNLTTSIPNMLGASILNPTNMSISEIFSGSKMRNEITITPVGSQYEATTKKESAEDDPEDNTNRLVIDEDLENTSARNKEDNRSEDGEDVPQCQGCNQKPAQFVCAGCGNQWYCSRDCQVAAWDDHSEVCSG